MTQLRSCLPSVDVADTSSIKVKAGFSLSTDTTDSFTSFLPLKYLSVLSMTKNDLLYGGPRDVCTASWWMKIWVYFIKSIQWKKLVCLCTLFGIDHSHFINYLSNLIKSEVWIFSSEGEKNSPCNHINFPYTNSDGMHSLARAWLLIQTKLSGISTSTNLSGMFKGWTLMYHANFQSYY